MNIGSPKLTSFLLIDIRNRIFFLTLSYHNEQKFAKGQFLQLKEKQNFGRK